MSNSRLFLLFILLLATFFRFYQLPQLPAGLNFDEAGNGVAAAEILTGAPRIWWRIGGGKEPLWPLLVALSTAMWGYIPLALRLPAVMVGILSVAAVYPLTMSLFRNRQAYPIASLTMLGLAISGWHLHFSRLGFRAILLPLLSTLAFYFFWAGLTGTARDPLPAAPRFWRLTRRDLYFVLAAFFLALAIYSYLAARLLPVVLIVFVVLQWLMNRLWAWSDKGGRGISRPDSDSEVDRLDGAFSLKPAGPTVQQQQTGLLGPLVRLFALMILFLSPLIVYFLLNPNDFAARSEAVSIFNPAWNNGDLVGTAWRTLAITVGTYLGLPGDANPLVNLPYQSALPHILVPFFVLGLATSLYRAVRPPTSRLGAPLSYLLVGHYAASGYPGSRRRTSSSSPDRNHYSNIYTGGPGLHSGDHATRPVGFVCRFKKLTGATPSEVYPARRLSADRDLFCAVGGSNLRQLFCPLASLRGLYPAFRFVRRPVGNYHCSST
jgi:hypothetical protein